MTDIIRRIMSFLHGTDSQRLHQIFFWFTLYVIQQLVDTFGYIRFRPFRTHLVTEAADECGEVPQFFRIRLFMNTIDKRFLCPILALSDKLGYRTVGQQHEFFNQFISFLRFFDVGS